ncbi:MAG: DUF3810 domain-containing protein [Clostridia bacterium]|nr:DUF3810 domain-containing protein [Clostridia bacterium]
MKFKDFKRRYITPFAKISVCVFAFAMLAKFIAMLSPAFADFFNRYISSFFRGALAYMTAVLPFSLAEAIIIMLIPAAVIFLIYCATSLNSDRLTRRVFDLVGLICLLLAIFTVNFGIAYDCTPMEEKAGLDAGDLTASDIYDACIIALAEADALESEIVRDEIGSAVMPYGFSDMGKKLNVSFENLYGEYKFLSPLYVSPKRIALSKPMTYTRISGIYTFFTGEANVNTNFPDYSVTFTAAHEMAHQRGVAPEDEANFVAFLACVNSDDPYIRYCGFAEIANHLSNTLYEADKDMFYELSEHFSGELLTEYTGYVQGFSPYANSAVGDVSHAANDAYLKSQGQSAGADSYGLVSSLAAAYILENYK